MLGLKNIVLLFSLLFSLTSLITILSIGMDTNIVIFIVIVLGVKNKS